MTTISEEFQRSWLTSIIGTILFGVGIWLLTWNEGRAVHHAHSLDEAYSNVISLNPYDKIKPEHDGRLIHISGPLIIDEPLTEPEYGISVLAVKLKRRVQMYQWVEEKRSSGMDNSLPDSVDPDTNDYYYNTEWRDKLVDSQNFYIRYGHQNPLEIPLENHIYMAPSVRIGQLVLGGHVKDKFKDFTEITGDDRPENKNIKLHMGIYYHCDDVWNAKVGDIRVQFYYAGVGSEVVTVIAKQQDGVLIPYKTSKDHEVALVRHGSLNVNQMFLAEHSDARLETWKLRALGVFALYASIVCLARIFRKIFSHLPLLRSIFGSDISSSSNFLICVSISLFTIATAWIAYRPMLGLGLLFAAVSPFLYCTIGIYNTVEMQNGYYNR